MACEPWAEPDPYFTHTFLTHALCGAGKTTEWPADCPLHPSSDGKEGAVYLQFIVDNYDRLPDTMLFLHGHECACSNFFTTFAGKEKKGK